LYDDDDDDVRRSLGSAASNLEQVGDVGLSFLTLSFV